MYKHDFHRVTFGEMPIVAQTPPAEYNSFYKDNRTASNEFASQKLN